MSCLRTTLRTARCLSIAAALSGCYDTNAPGSKATPDDEPSDEMTSSSSPPVAGSAAPSDPPPVRPMDPPSIPDPPATPPERTDPSVSFEPEPGFAFMPTGQIVGDLDADGFDDLVMFATDTSMPIDLQRAPVTAAYVFYGREDLPAVLRASSPDAVLRGEGFSLPGQPRGTGAIGDLNGDGFADVVLGGLSAAYFLFGSEERLAGELDIVDAAVVWTFDEQGMSPVASAVRIAAVGDVQGDGLPDLALTTITEWHVTELDNGSGGSPIESTFVVAGREGEWPSGTFEPEWAETVFAVEGAEQGGCALQGAADLDGDGFSDLLLQAGTERRLVRGGDDVATGMVEASEAGEPFFLPGRFLGALPDLDGDGSQEIGWTDLISTGRMYVTFGASGLSSAGLATPDIAVATAGMSSAMTVTDFDGDGANDLMLVAGGTPEAPVGLYRIPTAMLADAAGDIELTDLRLVLQLADAGPVTNVAVGLGLDAGGDVNGDGIDDVLISTLAVTSPSSPPWGASEARLLLGGAGKLR
jgi:hypothetical protein